MIFVTVGTHEQPFNRLIQKVDELVRDGKIKEKVFMQIGFSTYIPRYCKWSKVIGYDEMTKYMQEADVIITHGGPATYMQVLQWGKQPIVVPRQAKYKEHVNDHQLDVTKQIQGKGYPVIICNSVDELLENIQKVKKVRPVNQTSQNKQFVENFKIIIKGLIK